MKRTGLLLGLMLGISAAGLTFAADDPKPKKEFSEKQLAQQQRMRDCSGDAKSKGLKGGDRKAFMKTCLSGGKVTADAGDGSATAPDEKTVAQRDKVKTCSADAKTQGLKGDARKTFMSECLTK